MNLDTPLMSKDITIHRFENQQWPRANVDFFHKFDKYLSNYFNCNITNYNKDGETYGGYIKVGSEQYAITDVDCVIENNKTGEFCVYSFTEYYNHYVSHLAKNDKCSSVLLAHFNYHNRYYWAKAENKKINISKIKPWIFLPSEPFDHNKYRQIRDRSELKDGMFFIGSGLNTYRKMVNILKEGGNLQDHKVYAFKDYLREASYSKIGLSFYQEMDRYLTPFDYPGELCYRDIEYIGIGLPYIRIEYKDSLYNNLIPNHHYISIPLDIAHQTYKEYGNDGVADLFVKTYNNTIGDKDFLRFISENQRAWYDQNISSPNCEKLTFELLGLEKWL